MYSMKFLCRTGLAILVALCAVTPALAQGDALPTPEEATNGWIALFDGETLFGWTNVGGSDWQVVDGILTCEGGSSGFLATTSQFSNYELMAKIRVSAEASAGVAVRAPLAAHISESGGAVVLTSTPEGAEAEWKTIMLTVDGNQVTGTAGTDVVSATVDCPVGYVGVQYHNRGKVEVASIKLRPTGGTSLFNGQDLSGWNIIPDHKSIFSVQDGALNIKDGNGQIETEGEWRDFLFQLDIISNGEHLNSGVFYRSPKGVFWRGYESQIRNQWNGDDRTSPVDYGTGGIYGNQASRKVVSSDGEWFKKTIVVTGPHMAVWINGYQASDFTDMRPAVGGGAGKEGYVPEAGTITLQGHDPTTDLSFKNITIQSYDELIDAGKACAN